MDKKYDQSDYFIVLPDFDTMVSNIFRSIGKFLGL